MKIETLEKSLNIPTVLHLWNIQIQKLQIGHFDWSWRKRYSYKLMFLFSMLFHLHKFTQTAMSNVKRSYTTYLTDEINLYLGSVSRGHETQSSNAYMISILLLLEIQNVRTL